MISKEKTFKTPELLLDGAGNMFTKTSLEVTIDDMRSIAILDAEQVELFLKLLRVVDYEK
jgi:hypothetical protein